jgi:hypothetical protein
MFDATMTAVKALLKTDPALTPEDRARIVAAIRNRGKAVQPVRVAAAVEKRILTRGDVAGRFNRSVRFVDRLAVEGIIRRVKLPGRKRACGFLAEEVERVMAGEGGEA